MNGIESIKKVFAFAVLTIFAISYAIFAIPRVIVAIPRAINEEIRIMKDFVDEVMG
jgi:hypothetical protein